MKNEEQFTRLRNHYMYTLNLVFFLLLLGLRYSVFGLGNSTYEHFNAMGKFVDKKLEEMGGKRVHALGQVCSKIILSVNIFLDCQLKNWSVKEFAANFKVQIETFNEKINLLLMKISRWNLNFLSRWFHSINTLICKLGTTFFKLFPWTQWFGLTLKHI